MQEQLWSSHTNAVAMRVGRCGQSAGAEQGWNPARPDGGMQFTANGNYI